MKQATLTAILSRHHPFYYGLAANLQKYGLKRGEGEGGREGYIYPVSSFQCSYRVVLFYGSKKHGCEKIQFYSSFDLKKARQQCRHLRLRELDRVTLGHRLTMLFLRNCSLNILT
jgi:hypothetical protein